MDLMIYVNLMLSLIMAIAIVYAIDAIVSIKGEIDDHTER